MRFESPAIEYWNAKKIGDAIVLIYKSFATGVRNQKFHKDEDLLKGTKVTEGGGPKTEVIVKCTVVLSRLIAEGIEMGEIRSGTKLTIRFSGERATKKGLNPVKLYEVDTDNVESKDNDDSSNSIDPDPDPFHLGDDNERLAGE